MSISSTNRRNDYVGNGSTATYAYTFKILSQNDLLVTERVIATGVETTLALTSGYTVTGVGQPSGGNIVLVAGNLPSTKALTIRMSRSLKQETDIRNQGDFFPEVHEDAFDSVVMQNLTQQDELDRGIKLPETIASSVFSTELPASIAGSVSKTLVTNSTGDGFDIGPAVGDISGAAASAAAAAASASAAATSATNAATSATNAATSATNASNSASAAATSAANVLALAEYADDAAYVTANGTAETSDVYYNTTSNVIRYFNGTSWRSLIDESSTQALSNKDIDGGTASNARRITLPKASKTTLDGLTRKEGTITYGTDTLKAYIDTGSTLIPIGSGGGGAVVKWTEGGQSPLFLIENDIDVYSFEDAVDQYLYAAIKVPSSYTAGSQISLVGHFYSSANSGTILLQTLSTLIRNGTDAVSSTTNQRTSTNSAVTLSAGTVDEPQLVTFDLTSTTGQINSVSVSANDMIKIRLTRNTGSDTSTGSAQFMPTTSEASVA